MSGDIRVCPHGFHHPEGVHSCDGCWCEGERDRRDYGWPHDTTPHPSDIRTGQRDDHTPAWRNR